MSFCDKLQAALTALAVPVFHFTATQQSGDYIVWSEDGAGDALCGNGGRLLVPVSGTVDLFIRSLDDADTAEAVETALASVTPAWELTSIQYERDTGYKHYEWQWEGI